MLQELCENHLIGALFRLFRVEQVRAPPATQLKQGFTRNMDRKFNTDAFNRIDRLGKIYCKQKLRLQMRGSECLFICKADLGALTSLADLKPLSSMTTPFLRCQQNL